MAKKKARQPASVSTPKPVKKLAKKAGKKPAKKLSKKAKKPNHIAENIHQPFDANILPFEDQLNVPPDQLVDYAQMYYGPKGAGKTTAAASFPGYVVVQAEPLRKNLKIRQTPFRTRTIEELNSGTTLELPTGYGGVVRYIDPWIYLKEELIPMAIERDDIQGLAFDTIDRVYEACYAHHCCEAGVELPQDSNDGAGLWKLIAADYEAAMNTLVDNGKGMIFLSHAKERTNLHDTAGAQKQWEPSCTPAAFRYAVAACDLVVFLGYHDKERCFHFRGYDGIFTSCNIEDRFFSPSGNPLEIVNAGKPGEAYSILNACFNNQVPDLYEE